MEYIVFIYFSADKDKIGLEKNDSRSAHSFPDLEELTNQIFDDLLKCRPEFQLDGLGVVDLEKKSDVSSIIILKMGIFKIKLFFLL